MARKFNVDINLSRAAPVLLEGLVLLVAAAFFVVGIVSAGMAIRSAVQGTMYVDSRSAAAAAERAAAAAPAPESGAVWFSQPDGTFLTGDDVLPALSAPATVREAPPPSVPVEQEEAETPPVEPEEPVENRPDVGISTGLTAPGAQDWTVLVWISQADRNYHSRNDCDDTNPDAARQVMIQEAVALGYQRCGECW